MSRTAVVVGAGVGGLAVSSALVRAGWEVLVLERADEVRAVGSALALWANAVRAVEFVDPAAAAVLRGRPSLGGLAGLRTPSGAWLARMDVDALRAMQTVDAPIMVERPELHAFLGRQIPSSSFLLGRTCTAVSQVEDMASVRAGGDAYSADLVIGADGIGSVVRAAVDTSASITSARYVSWRGIVPASVGMEVSDGGETWGRGQRFGYIPLSDGGIYWYATLGTSRPRAAELGDQKRLLSELFSGWHEPVGALIAATPAERVLRNDVNMLWPQPRTYVHGRVALLGDAAHAMTPDLGQGAAMALEDAVELAIAVGDVASEDVPAALLAYDALRRPRAGGVAAQSRRMGQISQLSGLFSAGLRDVALRLIPSSRMAGGFGATANWQPSQPPRAIAPE
ncbi:FAD-dependent monooxygenase [Tenggerimyces flavus]|uniref:FAD-dependent monooxygenase n=1 Tax=Tenggerimyces flavus TaxID=1708749 RepID=A0ABV7Y7N6_9ACTN|nr:FAD-dependent monooxygenase [Tenggerimyces flavus]MBM7785738.1 2-polyprenyl-6-methoxyphenol hydroxylase-like FAD-dependent oxidoreductase [Tenggerimyces flavus]